jgi:hypothetical protein
MKKSSIILLALLIGVGLPATAMAGTITGDTVTWQYYAYGAAYNGPSSFTAPCSACGNFDGYFEIETTANTITFDYSGYAPGSGSWSSSGLSLGPDIDNGIELLFSSPLTSVSIDPSTNMAGFNSSDLYWTGSEIEVNWADLAFDDSTRVTLDLDGGAAATPEPASLMLLGTGLLAGVGVVRRKLAR